MALGDFTTPEMLDKLSKFFESNGVLVKPVVALADDTLIMGMLPSRYWLWSRPSTDPTQTKYWQTLNLINDPEVAVKAIMEFLSIPAVLVITWEAFIHPAPPPHEAGESDVVGGAVPNKDGFFYNKSGVSSEGQIYVSPQTGKRYILRLIGLFGSQWEWLHGVPAR